MKEVMRTGVGLIVLCTLAIFLATSRADGQIKKYAHGHTIGFSSSKMTHAGASLPSDATKAQSSIRYMVKPWNGNCSSTHVDQVCDATSLPKCQEDHPDNKNNKWRPFDIYVSHDEGHTYPTYPDYPDTPRICLNTIALKAPARAPLDPQLVFREATKLVPNGQWHPEPDGQAVVNKPVIVTVETNRDQTFAPFTLLGYHVEVKAHIDSYEWQYGDGTPASAVDWPGQDFNSAIAGCTKSDCTSYVNHTYNHAGTYSIQLTLHWRATYRVDGGNWQPVPGNITTTSPTQNMTILNAHSQLVTGN